MMNESELRRFISQEIKRQMNIILSGTSGNASEQYEDVQELFPSMPTISNRPVMSPYGISSAAPDGTISVVARQGEHFGNRIVLGHRDKNKPSTAKGELVLYDANGNMIEFRKAGVTSTTNNFAQNNTGKMSITSNQKELFDILFRLVTTIINARTNTILGPQPLIPNPAGGIDYTFTEIKSDLQTMQGS